MNTKINANLLLCIAAALIVAVHSLSIRDFSPEEINDIEPDHTHYAAVARYVVHKSEWASVATISTSKNISGFPMVNLKSMADSAKGEPSTGHIYFYLTTLDFTGQDLLKDNKLTVMFSNDQDLACSHKGVDPQEPTCARIIMSGSAVKLDVGSDEFEFANRAFLSRHPAAVHWIEQHSFFLCKLDILQIIVLDWYGAAQYVEATDYYNANSTVNGFLDKSMGNRGGTNGEASATHNKNEEKIRIEIKKGDDAVVIEL